MVTIYHDFPHSRDQFGVLCKEGSVQNTFDPSQIQESDYGVRNSTKGQSHETRTRRLSSELKRSRKIDSATTTSRYSTPRPEPNQT